MFTDLIDFGVSQDLGSNSADIQNENSTEMIELVEIENTEKATEKEEDFIDLSFLEDAAQSSNGNQNSSGKGSNVVAFSDTLKKYQERGSLDDTAISYISEGKTIEEQFERFDEKYKESLLNTFTETQKKAILAFENGVDVEVFQNYEKHKDNWTKVQDTVLLGNTDEKRTNRLNVIAYHEQLVNNIDKDKALLLAKGYISEGTDEDQVLLAKKGIIDFYSNALTKEVEANTAKLTALAEEESQKASKFSETVNKSTEILGYKVTDTFKKEIIDLATNNISTDPNKPNNQLNKVISEALSGKNEQSLINLTTICKLTNNFTDLKPLEKIIETRISKNVRQNIRSSESTNLGNSLGSVKAVSNSLKNENVVESLKEFFTQ